MRLDNANCHWTGMGVWYPPAKFARAPSSLEALHDLWNDLLHFIPRSVELDWNCNRVHRHVRLVWRKKIGWLDHNFSSVHDPDQRDGVFLSVYTPIAFAHPRDFLTDTSGNCSLRPLRAQHDGRLAKNVCRHSHAGFVSECICARRPALPESSWAKSAGTKGVGTAIPHRAERDPDTFHLVDQSGDKELPGRSASPRIAGQILNEAPKFTLRGDSSPRRFTWDLGTFFTCLRQANCDGLFAARHGATLPAPARFQSAALLPMHCALNTFGCSFTVSRHSSMLPSAFLNVRYFASLPVAIKPF